MKKTFKTIEDLENALMVPVTPEEQKEREEKAPEIRIKEWLEEFEKDPNVTKNPDGTYDFDYDVDISLKNLKKFPVKFNVVKGDFYCPNTQLTTLEGAPKEVKMHFVCSHNQLISLKGDSEKVGGYFDCRYNKLTSLEGAPIKVKGSFDCSWNKLTSLEGGAPKEVGGDFWCYGNPVKFDEEDVRTVSNVKGKIEYEKNIQNN